MTAEFRLPVSSGRHGGEFVPRETLWGYRTEISFHVERNLSRYAPKCSLIPKTLRCMRTDHLQEASSGVHYAGSGRTPCKVGVGQPGSIFSYACHPPNRHFETWHRIISAFGAGR